MTQSNTVVSPHDLYQRQRASLIDQLQELRQQQVLSPVAACPGWTVHDVVAHLSGLVAETLAGVALPRGSDEATARQVADRAAMTLSEICEEWLNNAAAFADFAQSDLDYVAALASDLVVHSHDIAEAIGLPIDQASPAVAWVATRYLAALKSRAELRGIEVAVEFVDDVEPNFEQDRVDETLTLATTAFTFLRCVTGRRSRQHVEALEWFGDPTALLDTAWNQYGAMTD